jgi:hypothetical protein
MPKSTISCKKWQVLQTFLNYSLTFSGQSSGGVSRKHGVSEASPTVRPATQEDQIRLLTTALVQYVERYGLTDLARNALSRTDTANPSPWSVEEGGWTQN